MTVVISVENLSKSYNLGQIGTGTLSRDLNVWWARLRGKPNPMLKIGEKDHGNRDGETLWALKDVNFTVEQGEALGIIGSNGAGKSTLLKILSRVTAPTSGHARVKGRIASLLEVGTGFHPDLTGRENIYLNGAILGMTRKEVRRKLDEIVAFAEIEQFLDTPVKRYSSGMYVRLAFAVAAHLDPEILVVDEVLAVGDAEFQKKCLGKMGAVAREGRTVLFVSHNLPAVIRLCPRAVLLDKGVIKEDSATQMAIGHYMHSDSISVAAQDWNNSTGPGDNVVRLKAVRVKGECEQISETFDIRKAIRIEMEYDVFQMGVVIRPSFILWNDAGICAFATTDTGNEWVGRPRNPGRYLSSVMIPGNFLAEGWYSVNTTMASGNGVGDHIVANNVVSFQVADSMDGDSARGVFGGSFPGVVRPKLTWTTITKDQNLPRL